MKQDNAKIIGIIGTLVIHALAVLLLFLIVLHAPEQYEESGMEVMLGDVPQAKGDVASYRYTEVQTVQPEATPTPKVIENTAPPKEEPIITQKTEETVAIKTPEKTEAEKQAEAEKKAAQTAATQMANAFGKSNKMEAQGSTTANNIGSQGAAEGNPASTSTSGNGVSGSYDLGGRGILGSLPTPTENVQDEGRVVVNITVDSEGNVVDATISLKTTTTNTKLRDAATRAAKRAKFAPLAGADKQQGTITYTFKLR